MPFVARVNYKERKARAYFYHSQGAPLTSAFETLDEGVRHVDHVLDKTDELKPDFRIPIVWADPDSNAKIVEVFGYSGLPDNKISDEWRKLNPEMYSWVFVNGFHKKDRRQIACEESLVLLGLEAQYRRKTRSFAEYMIDWPVFDNSEILTDPVPLSTFDYLPNTLSKGGTLASSNLPMKEQVESFRKLGLEVF